jgi:hypothetical protein
MTGIQIPLLLLLQAVNQIRHVIATPNFLSLRVTEPLAGLVDGRFERGGPDGVRGFAAAFCAVEFFGRGLLWPAEGQAAVHLPEGVGAVLVVLGIAVGWWLLPVFVGFIKF